MMTQLPTGTVTFLFTDIEGSTRLLQRHSDEFPDLLATHSRLIRSAIAQTDGVEIRTEGDSFFVAFVTAPDALRAAVLSQQALAGHAWPVGGELRVRMGLHTGVGRLGGDNYVGVDVNRAARISAAGHGGQVLISEATKVLIEPALPDGVFLRDLGRHRLKDLEYPEHLYDLVIDGLPSEFPSIRTLDARPTNLPRQRTSFVGRDAEVAEVTRLLAEARLLTLTGPGGTGKTRLALKVASDHLDHFTDGVFFADVAPIVDSLLVPSVIAQALMVREEPSRELLDTLADHIRNRHLLIVLDNAEQVPEAAISVARLLDAAPRLTMLVTSRVPLHISGEHEYSVPPMALPDVAALSDLDAITRSEAVALLAERAGAVRPGFRVTAENASVMAEITVRLDGLPLAIELAASRLKVLSPGTLLDRLGHRLSLLSGGRRDLPERQRTLRATIDWSHDLLTPQEQHLFAQLAVFTGGWTLEAAEAICADGLQLEILDGLSSLVDQSLVRQEENGDRGTRFLMLETIREYATERLAESGEEANVRRRHAEHFRDLAENAELHLVHQNRILWLARLEAEHDNLRAALDWTRRTENPETGLRTAAAIWRFWLQKGHLSEGRARLEELLALNAAGNPGPVRARALGALGGISYWQNDYLSMRAAYEEAIDIARNVGDPKLLASALLDLSFIWGELATAQPHVERNPDLAEVILQEGMTAAEEAGDPVLTAELWRSIAALEVVRGNPAGAVEQYRTAIEILGREEAAWKVADSVMALGFIMRLAGNVDAARGQLREALQMFAQSGDTLSVSVALTGLALVANDDGLPEKAARLVGASARIRRDIGGGIPPEQMGDPETAARQSLGELTYQRARAEGYEMDTETAVAYALRDSD